MRLWNYASTSMLTPDFSSTVMWSSQDCRVGTFEKTRGLPPGTIRNSNGRDPRSDKKIGTIRKESTKNK